MSFEPSLEKKAEKKKENDEILEEENPSEENRHALFGKTAILLKMITQDQLNDALLAAVTSHKGKRLGEILVDMGYLNPEQVEMILARQKTKMMYCPQCQNKYQILLYQDSKKYECKHCQTELQIYKSKLKSLEDEKRKSGLRRIIPDLQKDKATETQSFRVMSQTSRLIGKSVSKTILGNEAKKDEESKKLPILIERKEEENPYKMKITTEGKYFPSLGYNQLPPEIWQTLPKYERKCHCRDNDSLTDIMDWYGISDVSEVSKGKYGNCYVGLSSEFGDLAFIKHSQEEAAILTYRIELLAHLAMQKVFGETRIPKLIHTKDKGSFLIQRFCAGDALSEIVISKGKIDIDASLYIAQQVADRFIDIHSSGIVHFDLKPRNILVETPGMRTHIVDFGCSIYLGSKEKISYEQMGVPTNDIFGTPSYMAHEQISKKEISRSCDQVPLGCMIYRMITGNKLYQGATMEEIINNKLQNKTEKDILSLDEIPLSIRKIILRCIERLPQERYKNMRELSYVIMQARLELKNNRFTDDLL
ncbi:MAG: protein kinase [Candidatus Brocadiae bacterium]|nr:protein kinase [Candidatus Brocadiia bacterium]